jgi:hypothetical protein
VGPMCRSVDAHEHQAPRDERASRRLVRRRITFDAVCGSSAVRAFQYATVRTERGGLCTGRMKEFIRRRRRQKECGLELTEADAWDLFTRHSGITEIARHIGDAAKWTFLGKRTPKRTIRAWRGRGRLVRRSSRSSFGDTRGSLALAATAGSLRGSRRIRLGPETEPPGCGESAAARPVGDQHHHQAQIRDLA